MVPLKRFLNNMGGILLFAAAFLAVSWTFGIRVRPEPEAFAAACQSLAGGFFSGAQASGIALASAGPAEAASGPDGSGRESSPPVYPQFLESTFGLFTYYNQCDPRWADALYGPRDPMKSHGCGPTALAMIVSSYGDETVTPVQMAQWADEHGYCIPGQGSLHSLISEGSSAFGLSVVSVKERTKEAVLEEIRAGRIVVALLKQGYFTDKGHFLILIKATEDGKVRVADPANQNNNNQDWDPEFILSQLRNGADAGGPLWSIGPAQSP